MILALHAEVRSDIGHVREGNEDAAFAGARLAVVADGMGGHAAGEVASAVAIACLAPLEQDTPGPDLAGAIERAVQAANAHLRDMVRAESDLEGMGTTLTALLVDGSRVALAHVGDSRCYLRRSGELVQLTHDHTLVQRLVDAGELTADEANVHPQRSLLVKALDGGGGLELDLSVREIREGDRFLLCTDGLSGVVSEETIAEVLQIPDPSAAADRLVDLALRGGGPDNITCIVADVVDAVSGTSGPVTVAGAAAPVTSASGAAGLGGTAGLGRAAGLAPDGVTAERPTGSQARIARLGTPAARAAALVRPHRPGQTHRRRSTTWTSADADTPEPHRLLHLPVLGVGALVLVLAVAIVLGGWLYVRTRYYVGADGTRVAIFQGVMGTLAGLHLSHPLETEMPLAALTPYYRARVLAGIPADSLASARAIVARLPLQPCATTSASHPSSVRGGLPTTCSGSGGHS